MIRHTGEYFIDVEGITVASVLSFQSARIDRAKLDAPQADVYEGRRNEILDQRAAVKSRTLTQRKVHNLQLAV